ncbi:carbohydrate porin [Prochlorococcus sp. AH-716-E13]|nr:carbohydrate porin [Prochlorococcus sp. AH-716-E13]
MKLFQQMLVATASVGLIAPLAAQASDVINLEGMNDYSRSKKSAKRIDSQTFINETNEDIAVLKGRVDGLEAKQGNFEAGAFSSTTTMDGKAIMWIGAVDGGDNLSESSTAGSEAVGTGYSYTMNLNTSFTGDDNLYVRLKAGENHTQWKYKETYHIETKDTSDAFNVDKMWYTFPVGESITAFVGPRIENYYMYVTPSIYQPGALKSMKLGGNSNFGASTDTGVGFKYEADSGFAVATNIVSKGADGDSKNAAAKGFMGKNDVNKWDTQIAYTTDRWHVSATLSDQQNWSGHAYNATSQAAGMKTGDFTGLAFRSYWRPENSGTATPEVSVGYDTRKADDTVASGTGKDSDSYFIGLTWRDMFQADDRIGFAVTQPLKVTSCNGTCSTAEVDPFVWEAYYAFRPNDSMEVRPAIFGGTDVEGTSADDIFGAVLTTTFKF